MTRHWTEDDCIDRIYGIGPNDGHLSECGECRALWQRVASRRVSVRTAIQQSEARVPTPAFDVASPRTGTVPKLVPALAGAGLIAAALLVIHPAPRPHAPAAAASTVVSASDAQFFDEVAALDESTESRATGTARALFEQDQEN
jgi:hypothetical protein